jgi:hypothetical protein
MMSTVMKKKPMTVAEMARLGGKARTQAMSRAERRELASKAGKARSKALSATERSRIAKQAVLARERKRKQRKSNA